MPREADIRQMTDADIRQIADRMNDTPHRRLGRRTPAEVFAEKMMEVAGRRSYIRNQQMSHFT